MCSPTSQSRSFTSRPRASASSRRRRGRCRGDPAGAGGRRRAASAGPRRSGRSARSRRCGSQLLRHQVVLRAIIRILGRRKGLGHLVNRRLADRLAGHTAMLDEAAMSAFSYCRQAGSTMIKEMSRRRTTSSIGRRRPAVGRGRGSEEVLAALAQAQVDDGEGEDAGLRRRLAAHQSTTSQFLAGGRWQFPCRRGPGGTGRSHEQGYRLDADDEPCRSSRVSRADGSKVDKAGANVVR